MSDKQLSDFEVADIIDNHPLPGVRMLAREVQQSRLERGHEFKRKTDEWLKSPAFETFVDLKHGIVGDVLFALQEGEISRGRAAECLAEIAHGATEVRLPEHRAVFAEAEVPGETVAELRRLLFLAHGCAGKYGDDGEMQCNMHPPIDLKRDPVGDIEMKSLLHGRQRLEAAGKVEEASVERAKGKPQFEWCDMCDGTGLMEGWNHRDGTPCPKCHGAAKLKVQGAIL